MNKKASNCIEKCSLLSTKWKFSNVKSKCHKWFQEQTLIKWKSLTTRRWIGPCAMNSNACIALYIYGSFLMELWIYFLKTKWNRFWMSSVSIIFLIFQGMIIQFISWNRGLSFRKDSESFKWDLLRLFLWSFSSFFEIMNLFKNIQNSLEVFNRFCLLSFIKFLIYHE